MAKWDDREEEGGDFEPTAAADLGGCGGLDGGGAGLAVAMAAGSGEIRFSERLEG